MSVSDREKSIRGILAKAKAATSLPSPKQKFDNKFDSDPTKSATGVDKLRAQQQRSQELNEYCDKAVAEIRASLERSQSGSG